MIIFLIGFMGSGKTTLGKQLAESLNYKFIDQDDWIEKKNGITISEFFSKYGEPAFRNAENMAIKELSKNDNCIIATGGGAPCFLDNMEIMNKSGITIYLKVEPKVLLQRLRDAQSHRPLIKEKPEEELYSFIVSKVSEREFFYSKSKIVMQSPSIQVQDIVQALEALKLK